MNRDRLLETAEVIESERFDFVMNQYVTNCGTGGCVAGSIYFAHREKAAAVDIREWAKDYLELEEDEADMLFESSSWWSEMLNREVYVTAHEYDDPDWVITRGDAVDVLRRVAKLGYFPYPGDEEEE